MTLSRTAIVAMVCALAAHGVARARADVVVIDNHRTVEVDCAKDPAVRLIGNHLTVTARGVCAKITISGNHATVAGSAVEVRVTGNHNTLTLAAADDILVDGNSNTVAVKKAVKLAAPRATDSGSANQITVPR